MAGNKSAPVKKIKEPTVAPIAPRNHITPQKDAGSLSSSDDSLSESAPATSKPQQPKVKPVKEEESEDEFAKFLQIQPGKKLQRKSSTGENLL
jgi:hypothetical protein